jgi:tRNA threonylcarbamoyladenosine biosynthesis protein TsaB
MQQPPAATADMTKLARPSGGEMTTGGTILAIDAAGHGCSVALWRDDAIAVHEYHAMSHGQAAELLPMIERVMAQGDLDLRQIERIAVAVGPGGFTGLRIGLATARGLGLAIGCPVIGISSFQATAAAMLSPSMEAAETGTLIAVNAADIGRRDILVALDSRRAEPYLARLASDLGFRQPPRLLDMGEIAALLGQPELALICGDGLQNLSDLLPPGLRQVVAASDAAAIARLAADPARRFDLPPDPQYLRPPDISQPKIRS